MESRVLLADLDAVSAAFPQDAGAADTLRAQILAGQDVTDRKNMAGHATACGFVLSPERDAVLLVHHKILNRWIQPGGHLDAADASPFDGALREIREETGLTDIDALDWDGKGGRTAFDFNVHAIPANPKKGEGEHVHRDFRFAFVAKSRSVAGQEEEVSDVRWFPLDALPPVQPNLAEALARLAKLIHR